MKVVLGSSHCACEDDKRQQAQTETRKDQPGYNKNCLLSGDTTAVEQVAYSGYTGFNLRGFQDQTG